MKINRTTLLRRFITIIVISSPVPANSQNLAINEFLTANNSVVADQDGEYDDWIELYNFGSGIISLAGYSLTDDSSNINKWTFPDTSIDVGSFIIIWADNDTEQKGLHTGFRLDKAGELIILSDSQGSIIDEVEYGRQSTDISTGRFPDGSGSFRVMIPTFSALNSAEEPRYEDLSDTLFNQQIVHKFELSFYTNDWQDSLRYNYEVLDQEYMPARLTYNDSIVLDSIGVRYKGNSSYVRSGATIKKPLKFRFDKYIDDQTLYATRTLNFSNCVADPSFMREVIAYKISGAYLASSRAVYANIYIDGELIGLYVQVEQVDERFLSLNFYDDNSNLYKASDDGATLLYRGENQSSYELEYELKTNENEDDWSNFINMIDILNNSPDESFVATMSTHLNLDNVISHLAFNMVFSNFDSYTGSGRNFYFYDDRDSGIFKVIPWDFNETFGVYTNNWNVITADIVEISNIDSRPLVRRVMENDSLRLVYFDRIRDMVEGPAADDSIAALTANLKSIIEEHVLSDVHKLYSSDLFFDNLDSDVRIELGQIIPGINSFTRLRNENLLAQLSPIEVLPGDCDNNGIVDALDVLPIGIYFQAEGQSREETSFEWHANPASRWYSRASTYADANGDGVVDEKDAVGIEVNWGNSHIPMGGSFAIDKSNMQLLGQYRAAFRSIFNTLQGDSEIIDEIKSLLSVIINGTQLPVPSQYSLEQNYPNPFNSTTIIRFSLPEARIITFSVFDLSGRQVLNPANTTYFAGQHEYILDATSLASGMYLYRLQSSDWSHTVRMTLLK